MLGTNIFSHTSYLVVMEVNVYPGTKCLAQEHQVYNKAIWPPRDGNRTLEV